MRRYNFITTLLAMLLITSCADDKVADDATPDGYGRLTITISTPEAAQTRAVSTTTPWLEGSSDERAIKSYHLLVCNGNTIIDAVSGSELTLGSHEADPKNYYLSTQTITSNPIPVGTYNDITFYCLANFTDAMMTAAGLTVSDGKVTSTTLPDGFETKVMQPIANGISAVPTTGLPMTGKLTQSSFTIVRSTPTVITDPLILWRMMAKLEFQFTNQRNSDVEVLGIEVDPINQATASGSGVYLISQDDLGSVNNLVPLFPSGATKTVSATWPLNETPTQNAAASVSLGGVFESTQLSWGTKLNTTGSFPTYDNVYTLQRFKTTTNVSDKDENAIITIKVTPKTGMTFTPKNITFKACRVGTDGGKFDVVAGDNPLATGVTPPRSNGDGGNSGSHTPPFFKEYSYAIIGTPTMSEYVVKIYLYNLNEKEYAFRDVVISGDVTNNTTAALQEHITLPARALTDVGPVTYTPASTTIAANGGTGSLFFYVNETDATFTTTENQLSLRFKIQRGDGSEEEIRYGMTTPYIDGLTGGNGFNVIRRNDWIHIPIHITDWQLRIEPLAFVPIAGYPATTVSSDGLNATFSTGGMIALQPFIKKYTDSTWRDFGDSEVTFASVTWKNSDGTDVSGDGKIVKTAFAYDYVTKCIIGELNQAKVGSNAKTTMTVNIDLGKSPDPVYHYSFSFNVILQ